MKMLKKVTISSLVVLMTLIALCGSALAYTNVLNQVIHLNSDFEWSTKHYISRSTKYSYVNARCNSVYPENNSGLPDTFGTIRCHLVDANGEDVSAIYSLNESSPSYSRVYIYEGYLDLSYVYIQFCGNSTFAAEAVVSYYSD